MNCNSLCRIDLLEHFDGTFSEGSSLNGVAFAGLAMPSILWTYSLRGQSERELDAYFQQHLVSAKGPRIGQSARSTISTTPEHPQKTAEWPKAPQDVALNNLNTSARRVLLA